MVKIFRRSDFKVHLEGCVKWGGSHQNNKHKDEERAKKIPQLGKGSTRRCKIFRVF